MEYALIFITVVVGLILVFVAGWMTWRIGSRLGSVAGRRGAWLGGTLGVLLIVFLGVVEAAATGAHPVTLLLMVYGFLGLAVALGVGAAIGTAVDKVGRTPRA